MDVSGFLGELVKKGKGFLILVLLGVVVYLGGWQQDFGDLHLKIEVCIGLQIIGAILIFVGIIALICKFSKLNKICLVLISLLIAGAVAIVVSKCIEVFNNSNISESDGQSQEQETTVVYSPTPTFEPTITVSPVPNLAAVAMAKYYDEIINSDDFELRELYKFQNKCSSHSVDAYIDFWEDFIPKYKIYACSADNTFDVQTVYYDRHTGQTSNPDGVWVRYVLIQEQGNWKIDQCSEIKDGWTSCDFYISNEQLFNE